MFLEPGAIGIQSHRKLLDLAIPDVRRIEENGLDLRDIAGDSVVFDRLQHHRSEALVQGGDLLDLPGAHWRAGRTRADDEHDRFRRADEPEQFPAPVFQGGQAAPVDCNLEAACFEGAGEPVRERHVAARMGNKDFKSG